MALRDLTPPSSERRLPALTWADLRPVECERLWGNLQIHDPADCWLWKAGGTTSGYGAFNCAGRSRLAYLLVYELMVGPVPRGLVLDHLCRNRRCCNPLHMEPVTERENILRGVGRGAQQARQTTCIRGHALDYVRPDGKRQCRTCKRLHERERRARLRAAA